jgi:hypothetical protein
MVSPNSSVTRQGKGDGRYWHGTDLHRIMNLPRWDSFYQVLEKFDYVHYTKKESHIRLI